MKTSKNLQLTIVGIAAAIGILLILWKPSVLIYGLQGAGLYAAVALPMALILGIVGIINLAHGEFMMLGAYLAYWFSTQFGIDPLLAMIPVLISMGIVGVITYKTTIHRVLGAPELNQLILTFGIAMVLSQVVNLIATSQPRKLSLDYVTASAKVGELSFGTYDFIFVAAAVLFLAGLLFFLRRTKLGKAAVAVGQNPKGARLVGINVDRTYLIIFSIALGLLGIIGTLFLTSHSIFPLVGGSYTMKSFCLVAMAGIGQLKPILWGSLALGVSESFIMSFQGYGGWADIVFFAIIVIVIISRAYKRTES
ncbi:MAG: branched-chain amino acid ABC transporter permease [Spirochaetales bacterium]|nr:branched-chain amino acid ABC transporter permease [Spirochaetales bacterium]MCF7939225.1 branched-chain amino acid ABC transporter permease [Spirochaetales bacterium]